MLNSLLEQLVEIGRRETFEEIKGLPIAGNHAEVVRFSSSHTDVSAFVKKLSQQDQIALIKAMAILEDSVGGIGSVTALHRLFPILENPQNDVFEWVLTNTSSYAYYSHDARSIEELDEIKKRLVIRRNEAIQNEQDREIQSKRTKAEKALGNLLRSIERGDEKAVQSLLRSLGEYASIIGKERIASILNNEN